MNPDHQESSASSTVKVVKSDIIMDLGDTLQGEGLAIKLMAARAVGAYAEGKDLSNKMQELLRLLIVENMKENATDEGMEELHSRNVNQEYLMPTR